MIHLAELDDFESSSIIIVSQWGSEFLLVCRQIFASMFSTTDNINMRKELNHVERKNLGTLNLPLFPNLYFIETGDSTIISPESYDSSRDLGSPISKFPAPQSFVTITLLLCLETPST